jgi:tetratricopeptide (TPR) repeat protein
MPNLALILFSLLALAFTLVTWLQPWHSAWEGARRRDQGVLAVFMGDGRRLFGEYFFRKADIYFHSGVYPSMFDRTATTAENHMVSATAAPADSHASENAQEHAHEEEAEGDHDHDHDHDHESPELPARHDAAVDWLDRFSRNFYPTRHIHFEDGADAREILPWIRISAELNPQRVATYTTAAYWLRRHMGKIDEAEQFLRDGLRANPGNAEILFELGRLFDEDRKDSVRAGNLYALALREWRAKIAEPQTEDITLLRQILAHLASIEERQGHLAEAIQHWQSLLPSLEDPTAVQERIAELEARLNTPPSEPAPTTP